MKRRDFLKFSGAAIAVAAAGANLRATQVKADGPVSAVNIHGDDLVNVHWPENVMWMNGREPELTRDDFVHMQTFNGGDTWIAVYAKDLC